MSGTFNDIDVPPTLVSFAVDVAKESDVITSEFKKAGDVIVLLDIGKDGYDLPDYASVMENYSKFRNDNLNGNIKAAYAVDGHGIALALSKMAFGNGFGFKVDSSSVPSQN